MLNDIVNRAKKICATMNMSAYIDLVDELSREQSYADYETLRLRRNAAYLDYERETNTSEKMRKMNCWKSLCLAVEDAYRREIKGEITTDGNCLGLPAGYKLLPNH